MHATCRVTTGRSANVFWAAAFLVGLGSCAPEVGQEAYVPRVIARFDPANAIIPTPNNLVLSDPTRQAPDLHLNVPVPLKRSALKRLCVDVAGAAWDDATASCVPSDAYRDSRCAAGAPCVVQLDYREARCTGETPDYCPPCEDPDCQGEVDLALADTEGCALEPAARGSEALCLFVSQYLDHLSGWPVHSTLVATFSDVRSQADTGAIRVDPESVTAESVLVYDVTELDKGNVFYVPGYEPRLSDEYVRTEDRRGAEPRVFVRSRLDVVRPVPYEAGHTYALVVLGGADTDDCAGKPCVRLTDGTPVANSYSFGLVKSADSLLGPRPTFDDPNALGSVVAASDDEARQLDVVRREYDAILTGLASTMVPPERRIARANVVLMATFTTHAEGTVAFDPAASVIPTPNDLLMGAAGTLAFPISGSDSAAQSALFEFLNTLDGFSVLSTVEVGFTEPPDVASLTSDTLRIVDLDADPPTLLDGVQVAAPAGGREAIAVPSALLDHGHRYLVAVTDGVKAGAACAGAADCRDAALPIVRPPAMQLLLLPVPLAVPITDPAAQHGHTACAADGQFWATQLPGIVADCDAAQLEPLRAALAGALPVLPTLDLDLGRMTALFTFKVGTAPESLIDPTRGLIPTPNDLLYFGPLSQQPAGQCPETVLPCTAGHLCAPIDCDHDTAAHQTFFSWLNQADGWSAVISGSALFSRPIDAASLAEAVQLLQITDAGLEPVEGALIAVDPLSGELLVAKSGHFERAAHYAVVVTNALRATGAEGEPAAAVIPSNFGVLVRGANPVAQDGRSLLPAVLDDASAATLEPVRAGLQPLIEGLASQHGIARDDIVALWTFTIATTNEALYNPDPTNAIVPFPNEVLQNTALDPETGRPLPGIGLPVPAEPGMLQDMLAELTKADGFSVMGSITTAFLEPLDPASFVLFDPTQPSLVNLLKLHEKTVAFADIADVNLSASDITAELMKIRAGAPGATVDARMASDAAVGLHELVLEPTIGEPLRQNRRFMVVLEKGLDSAIDGPDGQPLPIAVSPPFFMVRMPVPLALPDAAAGTDCGGELFWNSELPSLLDDCTAGQLETLRQAYAPIFGAMDGFCGTVGCDPLAFNREAVLLFWTFWTQSLTAPLEDLRSASLRVEPRPTIAGDLVPVADFLEEHNDDVVQPECTDVNDCLLHVGHVAYRATFAAKYLLPLADGEPTPGKFPTGPDGAILFDQAATIPLEFSVYLPAADAADRAHGYPLVLYTNGLGGRAENVLRNRLLDTLCASGLAVVAVDMPFHGQRATPGANSGDGFLSGDPFAVRDAFRQATLDQLQLVALMQDAQTGLHAFLKRELGTANPVVDTSRVSFVGASLGAMAGAALASVEPGLQRAVLNAPGGHFTRFLTGQPTGKAPDGTPYALADVKTSDAYIAGLLDDVLAALGLVDCTGGTCRVTSESQYRLFLTNVQWILDAADPVALAPYVRREPIATKGSETDVLIQVAGNDELFKRPISDELCRALNGPARGASDPCDPDNPAASATYRVYPGACHGFLAEREACGGGAAVEVQQAAAVRDVACFLRCGTAVTGPLPTGEDVGCMAAGAGVQCLEPEQCDDTTDNDGDGLADCDDSDCSELPACGQGE